MSIASEITRLQNAKSNLKSKLQDKGVSVGNERLDEMVNLVDNIQGGSGTDTTDATATASDILLGKTAYVNDEKIEGTIETYDGASDVGKAVVEGTPIELTTSAEMEAVLVAENIGKIYKYVGETNETFTNGNLYQVMEVE